MIWNTEYSEKFNFPSSSNFLALGGWNIIHNGKIVGNMQFKMLNKKLRVV